MPRICAPIAIFAYNRPWHLQKTVEALLRNSESATSEVFVFSDGPRNAQQNDAVRQVREFAKSITGFKSLTVVERRENWGLAKSIIEGTTLVCKQFGRVIVLEDDLVTSPFFLKFMNDGLDAYEHDDRVISVHGYVYPVGTPLPPLFFLKGADCLGWATWGRAWNLFEPDGQKLLDELRHRGLAWQFDLEGAYAFTKMLRNQIAGKNDSWAIRWYASAFLRDKLTLNPGVSLVKHIGGDGSGTNVGVDEMLDTEVSDAPLSLANIEVEASAIAQAAVNQFFRKHKVTFPQLVLRAGWRRLQKLEKRIGHWLR